SVSGIDCATCEMPPGSSHAGGISKSPASAWSSLLSNANSELLPAPLRPTRPTFSPGLMVVEAPCRTTLTPRRRLRFFRMIIGRVLQSHPRARARTVDEDSVAAGHGPAGGLGDAAMAAPATAGWPG